MAELIRRGLERPKRRKKTRPSFGAVQGRLEDKRRRSHAKKKRTPPKDSSDW
jgi:hypothetical protein